ncbi:MAG: mandelate racemase [Chloroflexi bacterium]|nr:mandelate racemase [Chloroflexota bacterium]|tara:strand:+ start:1170 stop:2282 length:1113 start_codon:yes stop_codon:yes gene_type:complete
MKIIDLTLTLFKWEGIPVGLAKRHTGRIGGDSQIGLLAISTDEGIKGHSFLGASGRSAEFDAGSLIHYLKPILMDQNPLDREKLFDRMNFIERNTTIRAVGAVDIALWDIAGKVAGLPIHQLLGTYRDSIPAYVSSPRLATADDYAAEALEYKSRGLQGYKIHPPAITAKEDIEICTSVRKAVGDDYKLMLDSIWAYNYTQALEVGIAIQELDYYWFEDPLAGDDIYNYVKLKEHLDIPIMATEHSPGGFTAYAPWLMNQATDYLRGDVAVKGGITAVMKTAHLAEAFHMNYEIHHGGNSLNNVANLHASMAIKNTELFEFLLPSEAQKYGLLEDVEPDQNGIVHTMNEPGLGAKIDFDLIERNKTVLLT